MKDNRSDLKKILVIQQYYYPDISAVAQLLGDLLTKLARDEHYEIDVLCGTNYRSPSHPKGKWKEFQKHNNVNIKRIQTTLPNGNIILHRLFEYILFYIGVSHFVRKNKGYYDLFISMTTPPLIGYLVARSLKRSESPMIYYVEDLYPELLFDMGYIKRFWIVQRLQFINKYIISRAKRVITLGSYMTRKLWLNYGINKSQVVEISNWVNDVQYLEPEQKDHFTILYSGNLGLAHDFSLLTDLLDEITDDEINVEFKFIGAGRQYDTVKKVFEKYKIKYQFCGYCEKSEHNNMLASADMLLISQKNETVGDIFPSKFYSYLAAGRPLLFLGTEKSEIGDFIKARNIGQIIEIPEDIPKAIEYINGLILNKHFHRGECEKISRIYQDEMGFEKSYIAFKNLIDEVIV